MENTHFGKNCVNRDDPGLRLVGPETCSYVCFSQELSQGRVEGSCTCTPPQNWHFAPSKNPTNTTIAAIVYDKLTNVSSCPQICSLPHQKIPWTPPKMWLASYVPDSDTKLIVIYCKIWQIQRTSLFSLCLLWNNLLNLFPFDCHILLCFYGVSKKCKLWNGIAQNYKHKFWWHLAEILKIL